MRYQLNLANRLGFMSDADHSALEPQIIETEKVMNSLIHSLKIDP